MKKYSESVGKPPGFEVVLTCAAEDRDHPWLVCRQAMYQKLYPDRKIVIRTLRERRHEPAAREIPV